jgi:hypothetical protein
MGTLLSGLTSQTFVKGIGHSGSDRNRQFPTGSRGAPDRDTMAPVLRPVRVRAFRSARRRLKPSRHRNQGLRNPVGADADMGIGGLHLAHRGRDYQLSMGTPGHEPEAIDEYGDWKMR